MARVLLGLVGKKGSGKTTSYDIIKEELEPVQEIQLAKKLKDTCSKVFNLDREYMDDPVLKEMDLETPVTLTFWKLLRICLSFLVFPRLRTFNHVNKVFKTSREILQYVGTEVLRDIDKQIHLKRAVSGTPKHGLFVITDVRFKDEMKYLHAWAYPYAWFFYIDRNLTSIDFHASEAEITGLKKLCTKVINNRGSLVELKEQIVNALVWMANELPYIGYGPYKRQLDRIDNQRYISPEERIKKETWKSSRFYLLRKFFKFLDRS